MPRLACKSLKLARRAACSPLRATGSRDGYSSRLPHALWNLPRGQSFFSGKRCGLPEVRCDDTRRPGGIVDDRRAQQHLQVLLRPVAGRARSEPSHQMRRCQKLPRGAGTVLGDSGRCDQKLASLGVEDARHDRAVLGCPPVRGKVGERVEPIIGPVANRRVLVEDEPQITGCLQRPGIVECADQNRRLVSQIAEREIGTIPHLVELSTSSEQRSEQDAGVRIADTRVLAANGYEVVRGTGKVGRLKNRGGGVVDEDRLRASQCRRPELVHRGRRKGKNGAETVYHHGARSRHQRRQEHPPPSGLPQSRLMRPRWVQLAGLPLEDGSVGAQRDVDLDRAVSTVLIVLRQPLPHLGRPHPNHGVVGGLVIRAAAEYFGPDDPFAKKIVFPGERVLDYILQKALALARSPKRRAQKDLAQGFPDPDGVVLRYHFGARVRTHRWTCSPPKSTKYCTPHGTPLQAMDTTPLWG